MISFLDALLPARVAAVHAWPPAREIRLGPGVVDALTAAAPPPPDDEPERGEPTPPRDTHTLFGMPARTDDTLAPGEWTVIDTFGDTIARGTLDLAPLGQSADERERARLDEEAARYRAEKRAAEDALFIAQLRRGL